jgi:hypothetical protein
MNIKNLIRLAVVVVLVIWGAPRLSSDWQRKHRQELLLEAIADRSSGTLEGLVSASYADDWGAKRPEILSAMDTLARQFLSLQLVPQQPEWTEEAVFQARLKFVGNPSNPIGEEVKRRAMRLTTPTEFHWAKESSLPWSWRLVKIRQPELAGIEIGWE